MTTFFQEVHDKYISINFPEKYRDILSLDIIVWYLAESVNGMIDVDSSSGKRIIEMDITSAFPSICKCIFGEGSDFIKKLNTIEDKIKKNIFIATNLKNTDYLKQLNVISKMLIMGSVFTLDPNSELLELKKDGIVFITKKNDLTNNSPFGDFVREHGFIIHYDEYKHYVRTNRTSTIIDNENNLIRKGIYKYMPPYLFKVVKNILTSGFIDEEELLKIYSEKYWKIISYNNLDELIDEYYICNNGNILSRFGKYENLKNTLKDNNLINPRTYLKFFVFPILMSTLKG